MNWEYTITIKEIIVDNEKVYETTIKELPDAADYAYTPYKACKLAIHTIELTNAMIDKE